MVQIFNQSVVPLFNISPRRVGLFAIGAFMEIPGIEYLNKNAKYKGIGQKQCKNPLWKHLTRKKGRM